jgi:hypothetical protein
LTLGSHHKRPFGPVDEFNAEEFFQVLDALARGALSHPVLDGRMGETPLANHVVKHLQGPNVYRLAGCLFICFANFRSPVIKFSNPEYRFEGVSSSDLKVPEGAWHHMDGAKRQRKSIAEPVKEE